MKKLQLTLFAVSLLVLSACNNNDKKENNETVNGTTQNTKTDTSKSNVVNNTTASTDTKTATNTNAQKYVIAKKMMGGVKVGMTKAAVMKLFPNAKKGYIMSEAGNLDALVCYDDNGDELFKASYEGDIIVTLETESRKLATAEGIKVGSLYPALKAAYPDINVYNAEGAVGSSEKAGLTFSLIGEIKWDDSDDNPEPKLLSAGPDVKVTHIWLN